MKKRSRGKNLHYIMMLLYFIGIVFLISQFTFAKNDSVPTVITSNQSINPSYTYSTYDIRPNADESNVGFVTAPLWSKIDDTSDDSDYITGEAFNTCELDFTTYSLSWDQRITEIQVYARGRREGSYTPKDLEILFSWRIGDDSLSSSNSIEFTSTSYTTVSSASWSGLNLDQADLNSIRLSLTTSGSIGDQYIDISALFIRITIQSHENPVVTINSPIADENLNGSSYLIQWTSFDNDGDLFSTAIHYKNGSEGPWVLIDDSLDQSDNEYLWDISGFSFEEDVYLRITCTDSYGSGTDTVGPFILQNLEPSVTLITPNGGEQVNGSYEITWTYFDSEGDLGTFSLDYSLDSGTTWDSIVTGLFNTTSYIWDVSEISGLENQCRIHIHATDGHHNVSDTSDSDFTIFTYTYIRITSPNGRSVWILDTAQTITWVFDGDITNVKIELYKDNAFVMEIISSTLNDGEFVWSVPITLTYSDNYTIKISDIAHHNIYDFSENFQIGTFDLRDIPGYNMLLILGILGCTLIILGIRTRKKQVIG